MRSHVATVFSVCCRQSSFEIRFIHKPIWFPKDHFVVQFISCCVLSATFVFPGDNIAEREEEAQLV